MDRPHAVDPRAPSAGRICLLTGATSGIGEASARFLAAQGFRILLVGRSTERGRDSIARIREVVPAADVTFFCADLTQLAETRRLAGEVRDACDRLDVLVNNAGAIFFTESVTREGNEATFALNVLTPFLLTELLLDRLEGSHGRVVNVDSSAHRMGTLRFEDVDRFRSYTAWGAYGQSKLALLMLTYEAARRHSGDGVTFNACHPGFVRSRFGDAGGTVGARVFGVAKRMFGISPESGARTPSYLAGASEVEGVSGRYFVRGRTHRSSRSSHDRAAAAHLWELCLERTAEYRAPFRESRPS